MPDRRKRSLISLYTFPGSFIWCAALAWVGLKLGEKWDTLGVYFHRFDAVVAAGLAVAIVSYIWRRIRHR